MQPCEDDTTMATTTLSVASLWTDLRALGSSWQSNTNAEAVGGLWASSRSPPASSSASTTSSASRRTTYGAVDTESGIILAPVPSEPSHPSPASISTISTSTSNPTASPWKTLPRELQSLVFRFLAVDSSPVALFSAAAVSRSWYSDIHHDEAVWRAVLSHYSESHRWGLYHSWPNASPLTRRSSASTQQSPTPRRLRTVLNGVEKDLLQLRSKVLDFLSADPSPSTVTTTGVSGESLSPPVIYIPNEYRDECRRQYAVNSKEFVKATAQTFAAPSKPSTTGPWPRFTPPRAESRSIFDSLKKTVSSLPFLGTKVYKVPIFGEGLETSAKKLVYKLMWAAEHNRVGLQVSGLHPGEGGVGAGIGFSVAGKTVNLATLYLPSTPSASGEMTHQVPKSVSSFISNADAVVYVLDQASALAPTLDQAVTELHSVLQWAPPSAALLVLVFVRRGESTAAGSYATQLKLSTTHVRRFGVKLITAAPSASASTEPPPAVPTIEASVCHALHWLSGALDE